MFEFSKRNPLSGRMAGFQITNIADDAFITSIIVRGVLPGQPPYQPVGAAAAKANERRVMAHKPAAGLARRKIPRPTAALKALTQVQRGQLSANLKSKEKSNDRHF